MLASEQSSYIHITDEKKLSGLSNDLIRNAAINAKKVGKDGWIFKIDYSTYKQVLENADSRELRKALDDKLNKVATGYTDYDNSPIIKEMVNLRLDLANIFGFSNYADYRLAENMLKSKDEVNYFLDELVDKAYDSAIEDVNQIKDYAKSKGFMEEITPYDINYFIRKYKEENYQFNENEIKTYLELGNVKKGIFDLYNSLYGLRFIENNNIQKHHPDVEVYEVKDSEDNLIGYLYLDFFARDSKSSGAWCMEIRGAGKEDGIKILPVVQIDTNLDRANPEGEVLISHFDLRTILHETGHAMHCLLSDVDYQMLTGFSVPRDFLELPSSIMESWAYEKEFLDTFAFHYKTGEKIPEELINKISNQRKFLNAFQFLGYIASAEIDMSWHSIEEKFNSDIRSFELEVFKDTSIVPLSKEGAYSTSFSHIFSDGYDVNYYSYIWAWVMEADMFEEFKKTGVLSKETGEKFKNLILAKGATEDPLKLYFDFVGSEPSIDPLVQRNGWN